MNTLFRSLRTENGDLRGRTGLGEPGLYTLLGGTEREQEAAGGGGAGGGRTRMFSAHRDVRVLGTTAGVVRTTSGGGEGEHGRPREHAK